MSFYKPIPIGSIVSFRYWSKFSNDRAPMVMVIAFNYKGNLHGLNIRYLNPTVLAQLQFIFRTPVQQQTMTDPFRQEIANLAREKKEKAEQEAIERKKQQLGQQKGVIVKPQQGNPFGVSTFGRSQAEVQPAYEGMPGIEGPAVTVDWKQTDPQIGKLRSARTQVVNRGSYILSNPYRFYHSYIKSIMPDVYVRASVYRQYKHRNIQNLRIVHSNIAQRHTEPVNTPAPRSSTMSPQQKGAIRRKANAILSKYEIK